EDYSVTVSRGCADSNAGCWAGGNALGDMQFAGSGTATGSWPYRNSYTTGNKSGQITFALTLPWLKPRDSCELGLLALGR
ncbi:MAG: hypothetical protein E6532_09730, partial [Bifidobacterium longum]|nr:hypothetical protein [Bifidobacterium longum]